MLTQEQRDDFRRAADFWNGDKSGTLDCSLLDDDDVVETRNTVQNFQEHRNLQPEVTETPWGVILRWKEVQAAKGCRRGNLFVMDFGPARASYFDGELSV